MGRENMGGGCRRVAGEEDNEVGPRTPSGRHLAAAVLPPVGIEMSRNLSLADLGRFRSSSPSDPTSMPVSMSRISQHPMIFSSQISRTSLDPPIHYM
jgi:hypothetical protein